MRSATGWGPMDWTTRPLPAPPRRVTAMDTARRRSKMRQVVERDGQDCWVCGEPVLPTAPEAERASLDHVVEIRDGGSHDVANLRLAHACCNESRDRNRLALAAPPALSA